MRFLTTFALLAAFGLMSIPVVAQCNAVPYTEDFETTTLSGTSCTSPAPIYPAGWSLDPSSTNIWNADTGGTGSSSTGPSVDFNPGTSGGIYLYTEASGCSGTTRILNSPTYDVSSLTNPALKFARHMWGATMGTLAVEAFDGTNWVPVWSLSGDQGNQWVVEIVGLPSYIEPVSMCPAVKFRFLGTTGTSFTSDMAIDDVTVLESPTKEWEVNGPVCSFDVDGVQANEFFNAAVVNKTSYLCGGVADPVSSTFTLSSTLPGNVFDIVTSSAPLVPATGGGVILADGQVVNVDLFQPYSFVGGGLPLFLPGATFPGSTDVTINIVTSLNTATNLSAQAVVIDGSAPLGFVLSQAVELNVVVAPPAASIPGPTSDSDIVSVDVTSGATCWAPGGVPFYGTTFTTMHVTSNGFVSFGGTDTDATPSLSDAINDDGRVGFWTDLDPADGGTVTISNPAAGIIRADWAGVFYDVSGPGVTFGIQFDVNTGIIQIDGLGGLVANPNTSSTADDQWLGITPGITFAPTVTTDPGAAVFGLGFNGAAAVATDMLYEFNDVSVSLSGLPASVVGGMTTLMFTPTTVGMGTNYQWSGM